MRNLQSSNPALRDDVIRGGDWWSDTAAGEVASISGIVNKTGLFAFVLALGGAGGYALVERYPALLFPLLIVNLVVSLGCFFMMRGSAIKARNFGFVYSLSEGLLLGGVAVMLEGMLAARDIAVPGGLVLQAFVVTIACLFSMLGLYRAGILKGGAMFTRVLTVATIGVIAAVFISFILSLFGLNTMIFNLGAEAGSSGFMLGFGVTIALLILASLWLIVDFRQAEELVKAGAPKETEWYAAFGLIVTIAWIYFESLKLVYYIALTRE